MPSINQRQRIAELLIADEEQRDAGGEAADKADVQLERRGLVASLFGSASRGDRGQRPANREKRRGPRVSER